MNKEINTTPEEFQERLNSIGGFNRFDDPNFFIVWGAGGHDKSTFRAGGVWTVDEHYFKGYRDLLFTSGENCWVLLQWHDAIEYGTPESYYAQNYDSTTGLQILGEYPYSGRYEVLYSLRHREVVPGEGIKFEPMPLCGFLLDLLVPIVIMSKGISIEKKKAAYEDMKEREEIAKLSVVEQRIREAALPFKDNAVSYARQGVRTATIDQKVLNMSKYWNDINRKAKQMSKRGTQTSSTGIK